MGVRFFSGSRDGGNKSSSVSSYLREQLRKGAGKNGTLNMAEIQKKMLEKKMFEAKFKSAGEGKRNFSMIGNTAPTQQRTGSRAAKAMEMLKQMEIQKEAKKQRKAVTVEAQRLGNGKIDAKGRVYDTAGNMVAKVNLKNGQITTSYGQFIGMYKAKSYLMKNALEQAITKNSPFLINQRKMQEMQKQQQLQQASQQESASAHFWSAPQHDIWGNPITDFFGRFF